MGFNDDFVIFQALEGSRELENILGVSHSSCDLSAELQKTQALGEEGAQCIYLSLWNISQGSLQMLPLVLRGAQEKCTSSVPVHPAGT